MSTETNGSGVVSTINDVDRTTVIVTDPWTGEETARLQTYVHLPEMGPPSMSLAVTARRSRITMSVHLDSAQAVRDHIRGMQHELELFERAWTAWERGQESQESSEARRDAKGRASDALAYLRGTPEGAEFADALDAEREGRAA